MSLLTTGKNNVPRNQIKKEATLVKGPNYGILVNEISKLFYGMNEISKSTNGLCLWVPQAFLINRF